MNSTDLLRTFCRLCRKSSDWWANEKECRDSDGNRLRSSVKFSVGEEGPEVMPMEELRVFGRIIVMELDMELERGPIEALREEAPDEGTVGTREGRCWRILRKPDAPSPCSCSVITGDLKERFCQPSLLLRFVGLVVSRPSRKPRLCHDSCWEGGRTDFDIVSYSPAASPASKENRILAFSVLGALAKRFEADLVLDMCSSDGRGDSLFFLPRSGSDSVECNPSPAGKQRVNYWQRNSQYGRLKSLRKKRGALSK